MSDPVPVAIVDFGLGNLFSVERACEHVGVLAAITDDPDVVRAAPGLILPGVGAFGGAMAVLRARQLDTAVLDRVDAGVPVLGICLGMQLLLRESEEFGRHAGLGVLDGVAVPLRHASGADAGMRVPHIGWSTIEPGSIAWATTPLADVAPGTHLYFVHSYFADLGATDAAASWTSYGGVRFCSSVQVGSVFACQFHPERSGPVGLTIYRRAFAALAEAVGV